MQRCPVGEPQQPCHRTGGPGHVSPGGRWAVPAGCGTAPCAVFVPSLGVFAGGVSACSVSQPCTAVGFLL